MSDEGLNLHPAPFSVLGDVMAERKPFLLRIDPQVLKALQKWADDDLRSLNGQIEYLLRRLLVEDGRLKLPGKGPGARGQGTEESQ